MKVLHKVTVLQEIESDGSSKKVTVLTEIESDISLKNVRFFKR